jgi:hypothetical protein
MEPNYTQEESRNIADGLRAQMEKLYAPSALPPSEPQGGSERSRLATCSLPAGSAHLFTLADKWDNRASHIDLEAEWLQSRDSRRATEYRTRAMHWRSAAEELRAEIVVASRRQPEETEKGEPTRK